MISLGIFKGWVFFLGILSLAGCTTVTAMQQSPSSEGHAELYDVPYQTAHDAALDACRELGLEIESQNAEDRVIVCKHGASLTTPAHTTTLLSWSYGERIGIYLKAVAEGQTEIRVVSKPVYKLTAYQNDKSYFVHLLIYSRLIALQEETGQFAVGPPFSETESGVSLEGVGQTLEELIQTNAKYKEHGIDVMGLSNTVANYGFTATVGHQSNRFTVADKKITWFCFFESSWKPVFKRPKFRAVWTNPEGKMVQDKTFGTAFGNADLIRNTLDLNKLRFETLVGAWRVQIFKGDILFDERKFEIALAP